MGIKDRIDKFINDKIDQRLIDKNITTDEGMLVVLDEDYKKLRNKVFYLGDTEEIYRFFKYRKPRQRVVSTNNFYNVATGNIPLLHYPLANIISKTMVNLLFSSTPVITAATESNQPLLDSILDENSFKELLQKACEYESYSGAVGFKPVIDREFSEYPILVPYPKEDMEVIHKYGKVTDIVFKDSYEDKKSVYMLFTICGKGYIKYRLYQVSGGNKKEVPLSTLEDTKDLQDMEFFKSDGTPYTRLMAVYKENKTNSESDYDNLADDFAALDEVYSNMMDFIRKSRIKTYMPESLMEQDVHTGKKIVKNEYDTSYVTLYDSNPAGTNIEAKRDIVDVQNSLQGYKDSFNNILLNALSTAGLSPASVGLDIAGANSSALALNIRERVSLRTRDEKQNRWTEAIEDICKLCLSLCSISIDEKRAYLDECTDDFKVVFAAYESPTFDEQISSLSAALDAGLITRTDALSQLYPDRSVEDIELMKNEIEGYMADPAEKELDQEEI